MFSPNRERSNSNRWRIRSVMTRVFPVPAPHHQQGPFTMPNARRCAAFISNSGCHDYRARFVFKKVKQGGHVFVRVARFQAKRKRNRIAALLLIFRLGRLSLRFLACGYVGVEFLRFAFRHRKWFPVRPRKMFCQKYDLPDVDNNNVRSAG